MFSSLAEYQEKRKKYFNNPPPSTSDISESIKQKILNSDVTTLINMLNNNEVTSVHILKVKITIKKFFNLYLF